MDRTTYRLVMGGLGLLLLAVVALAIAFNPGGTEDELPDALISVAPVPGSAVLPQIDLVIVMRTGYRIELEVDGVPIPPGELAFTEATGRYTWEPGPGNTFEAWLPGEHEIAITWDRVVGLPDQGSYEWSFRVQ